MRLPTVVVRTTRRLLPLLAAATVVAVLTSPVATQAAGTPASTGSPLVAQETTTSSTSTDQTGLWPTTTARAPAKEVQTEPNRDSSAPGGPGRSNSGWTTRPQMERSRLVRIRPTGRPRDNELLAAGHCLASGDPQVSDSRGSRPSPGSGKSTRAAVSPTTTRIPTRRSNQATNGT